MVKLLHFELSEFDSPDEIGSGKNMDSNFLAMLDDARGIAGIPFTITSGFRTPSHNAYVGGVQPSLQSKGSSHLFGYAADIAAPTSRQKYVIVKSLLQAGFNRIGIGNTFIHVDNDPDKDPDVIWTY
jgi:zinc D-Ala-D-Ala carboxypeptidase